MNLKSVRYFVTLSHCLNFTQTATKYHITQTAMSRYIASLEAEIGVKLFDRSSRRVALTEAGKVFAKGMEQIVLNYEELLEKTKAADQKFLGHIKVGIGIYEYSNTERYFSRFLQLYPDIKVDIFQYEYSVLTQKLKTDELDLIVTLDMSEREFQPSDIRTANLFSSENILLCSKDKEPIYQGRSVEDILKSEYLVTNCEDNGPSSIQMLESLLRRDLGFIPENMLQTNSLGAQLLMVKTGHGVAIVPAFLKEIKDESYLIMDLPQKEPQNYCIIMKSNSTNMAAERFLEYCEDGMNES